jgi:hypothetical protein
LVAVAWRKRAPAGGYSEKQQLLEDPDFANLHKDVRFASLLGEMGRIPEWCEDLDDANDSYRVYRGGSWNFDAGYCRSADRSGDDPSPRGSYNGFRLALSPSVKQPEAVHDK